MKIIYETERLVIRRWQKSDYKDLYEYASIEEVANFLTFKPYTTYQEAKDRIDKWLNRYKTEKVKADYAVVIKGTTKVIGSVSINTFIEHAGGNTVEIGFTLNPHYQGNGYATEAIKGLFKYIKANNIAKRIEAKCDVENTKSENLMKRAGMKFEGILRKAGTKNNLHTRYDLALYSILWEEIN